MTKFRFEGINEFSLNDQASLKKDLANLITERRAEQERMFGEVSIEVSKELRNAEFQIKARLERQWNTYTKTPAPNPKLFYIKEKDWGTCRKALDLAQKDIGGTADPITGNVVIVIFPEQSEISTIITQAHELSHVYKRTELITKKEQGKKHIEIGSDNLFLEESFATEQEKTFGIDVAKDLIGSRRVESEILSSRKTAERNSQVTPASLDYVFPHTETTIGVRQYYAIHLVTTKILNKVNHGWKELENARVNGSYSALKNAINSCWGNNTYELLRICPIDVQSAWFMSAFLEAGKPERDTLTEIIKQRAKNL